MYLFRTALSLRIAHRSAWGPAYGEYTFQDGHLSMAYLGHLKIPGTRMQWNESHSVSALNVLQAILSLFVLTMGWWLMQGNLPSPSMHIIRSRVYRRVTEKCLAAHSSD